MGISLILSPEVGVHYDHSGTPKDLLNKPDFFAQDHRGRGFFSHMAPNACRIPSLFSQEFNKRYYGFLSRMQVFLSDLKRLNPDGFEKLEVVFSGSYWKYYRDPKNATSEIFGSMSGDRSKSAAMAYRRSLEEFYSDAEFSTPSPAYANRWKIRNLDTVNLRWFYQHSENMFRYRSAQVISRNSPSLKVTQVELFTPEADPSLSYTGFLRFFTGGSGDLSQLSKFIDTVCTRTNAIGSELCLPYVHWTSLDSFRTLTDSEKQFLIMKSLLLFGSRGGGVLVDEKEWFSLSESFRSRVESIIRSLNSRKLAMKTSVIYLASYLWGSNSTIWNELSRAAPSNVHMTASLEKLVTDNDARLAIVEPQFVFMKKDLKKLLDWVKRGRILALPRSSLYSDMARSELECALHESTQRIDIGLGIPYKMGNIESGRLIVYEVPGDDILQYELTASWQKFITAMLNLAEIKDACNLSDGRLSAVPLARELGDGHALGLFILNGTGRPITADIIFHDDVVLSDLSVLLNGNEVPLDQSMDPGKRFTLEVPPRGVLPIAVEGIVSDAQERLKAALMAETTVQNVAEAALGELPGLELSTALDEGAIGDIWN